MQKISVSDLKKCIGVVQMQRSKSKSLTDGKKKIKTSKKKIKTKNKIISLKNKKNKFLIGVLNR